MLKTMDPVQVQYIFDLTTYVIHQYVTNVILIFKNDFTLSIALEHYKNYLNILHLCVIHCSHFLMIISVDKVNKSKKITVLET